MQAFMTGCAVVAAACFCLAFVLSIREERLRKALEKQWLEDAIMFCELVVEAIKPMEKLMNNDMNNDTDQEDYYRDLQRRQADHLRKAGCGKPWKPCAHDQCSSCHGTGIRIGGGRCVHMLHCDCPKCSRTSTITMGAE